MQALTAQQLLTVWELGQSQVPTWRAIALLTAASPSASADSLAVMTIGQRDTQLLRLREWAFGPRFLAVADCPQCNERLDVIFTADDIRSSEAGPVEPLSLTADGYAVTFRLPNSADLLALTDANDPQSARSILIERCVLQARFQDSDVTASGLAEKVVDAISVEMAASDPQADIQLALECAGCGHRWKAPFDIVTFFWSEIGAWVKRILREVHILASAYGWPEADILAMSPLRREFYLEMLGA